MATASPPATACRPANLSRRAATRPRRRGYHYKVNNQGTSGATTKDAVADLRSILLLHPEVVIVEFGGNDGLRGLPLSRPAATSTRC
jgi:lysophospholipase L1-like esterase